MKRVKSRSYSFIVIIHTFVISNGLHISKSANRIENLMGLSRNRRGAPYTLPVIAGDCSEDEYLKFLSCGSSDFTDQKSLQTCLSFSQEKTDYAEAQRECRVKSSNLLHIPDSRTDQLISSIVKQHPFHDVWIALKNNQGSWAWENSNPVTFTNWASTAPAATPGICVIKYKSGGGWSSSHCNDNFHYICQRKYPNVNAVASVELSYAGEQRRNVGDEILITCAIKGHDTFEKISIELHGNLVSPYPITFNRTSRQGTATNLLAPSYKYEGGICVKYTGWKLVRTLTYRYAHRQVSCCGEHADGSRVCSGRSKDEIEANVNVIKPNINVTFGSGVVSATCSAIVTKDSGLTWVMADENRFWSWNEFVSGTAPKQKTPVPGVSMERVETKLEDEGFVVRTKMTLIQRRELEGLHGACYSKTHISVVNARHFLGDKRPTRSDIFSLPLTVPQTPELKHTERRTPEEGHISTLNCSAFVGKSGVMTWSFLLGDLTGSMIISYNSPADLDIRRAPHAASLLRGTVKSEYNYKTGTQIRSSIEVNLTGAEHNKTIQVINCLSYNVSKGDHAHDEGSNLVAQATFDFRGRDTTGGKIIFLALVELCGSFLFSLFLVILVFLYSKKHRERKARQDKTKKKLKETSIHKDRDDDEEEEEEDDAEVDDAEEISSDSNSGSSITSIYSESDYDRGGKTPKIQKKE